ncbi:MAG: hypothetical protein ABL953_12845 [Ilumatobacteraceae bacterium]
MTRRRSTTAMAVVVSLAAISAGTWGLSKWRPFEHESASIEWPENIEALVTYIETTSDLRFLESIEFKYIADTDDYNNAAGDPVEERSAERLAELAAEEAVGRALGLWGGDASLVESLDTIRAAAPRPARWRPADNLMLINAPDEKEELAPAVRADLVVYLTQALIEQNFHLIELRQSVDTAQEFDALAAIHIGYALWIRDQYVDDLSADDREQYQSEAAAQSEEYAESVDSVPATFKAIRIAFQVLGPVFITALAEDDPALVLDAFRSHIPTALDQISLPSAKYLRKDATESIDAPSGPRGATILRSEQLGPFRLFLMLATGLPANEALTASDGWGNDRLTTYELDGRVCADLHVVADSPDDADRLERAITQWAVARPRGADTLVGRDDVHLYASVCDPGTGEAQSTADNDDIEQYFSRADLLGQQAADTGKPALAECIATEFFAQFTFAQLDSASLDVDLEAAFAEIEDDCRNSV